MKKITKKLSIFLAIVLLLSASTIECLAYDTHSEENVVVETSVQPRDILQLAKRGTLRYGTYYCDYTLYYTVRSESSNASGFYITGVLRVDEGASNWYRMGDITVQSIQYEQNCQKAYVRVQYTASIGAGYNTYVDTIVLDCYEI